MISIADFVDKEMDKITRQNPKLSLSVAAILTALNISDLYLNVQMRMRS